MNKIKSSTGLFLALLIFTIANTSLHAQITQDEMDKAFDEFDKQAGTFTEEEAEPFWGEEPAQAKEDAVEVEGAAVEAATDTKVRATKELKEGMEAATDMKASTKPETTKNVGKTVPLTNPAADAIKSGQRPSKGALDSNAGAAEQATKAEAAKAVEGVKEAATTGAANQMEVTGDKVVTKSFRVEGVCKMCKERIENAALIKGVKFAEWEQGSSMLTVIYRSDKTEIEAISKSLADAGHRNEFEKADNEAYSRLPGCCSYDDGVEKH